MNLLGHSGDPVDAIEAFVAQMRKALAGHPSELTRSGMAYREAVEQLREAVGDIERLRFFLEDISNTKSIDLAQGMALTALGGATHPRQGAPKRRADR